MLAAALQSNTSLRTLAIHAHSLDAVSVAADEPADDHPAVLMYTGGTTGLPKGVVLPQRAVALVIYRMQMGARFQPRSRYLAFMPMFRLAMIERAAIAV